MNLDDILDIAGDWLTEAGLRLIVDTVPCRVVRVDRTVVAEVRR